MIPFLNALLAIYCPDIEAAEKFYGKVLNLAESYRFPSTGPPEHIEFQMEGFTLAISSAEGLKSHGMPAPLYGNSFEIGLKTSNLEETLSGLKKANVPDIKEIARNEAGNLYAYISDPEGNRISLYQTNIL